jgi:DNA-directed RNA polymerase specialized sigma24 family protein
MPERIYSDDRPPPPERDPEHRRRLPTQEGLERDARVARLRRRGWSYREIARVLGCSLGAVQKSVRRNALRAQQTRENRGA